MTLVSQVSLENFRDFSHCLRIYRFRPGDIWIAVCADPLYILDSRGRPIVEVATLFKVCKYRYLSLTIP